MVVCSMAKRSRSTAFASVRISSWLRQSGPSQVTTMWQESAISPLVIVQTCRSCTAATPGTFSIAEETSATGMWRGDGRGGGGGKGGGLGGAGLFKKKKK